MEMFLQKKNHASAAFIFLICAIFLSIAQCLSDDVVYITMQSPTLQSEREKNERERQRK